MYKVNNTLTSAYGNPMDMQDLKPKQGPVSVFVLSHIQIPMGPKNWSHGTICNFIRDVQCIPQIQKDQYCVLNYSPLGIMFRPRAL